MAWTPRSLDEIIAAQIRAFDAAMPGVDASIARNNLHPVAKIIGGGLFEMERFVAWGIDQKFVLTADAEFLDRHGAEMKPAVPRKAAAKASGPVTVTAAGAITLATGAVLARSDGWTYTVDAGVVLAGAGSATVTVTAVTAGGDGNALAAQALTASSGLTGSATFAVAASGLGGGADAEADSAYRARLLFAKAYPEHGGASADWLRYTLAVPGVTRAFIDPLAAGRGSVVVYPFFDLTRTNGIGTETDRALVASALAVARPGAGLPVVRLPQAAAIAVTVTGLSPDTPEVRLAVLDELTATFARESRVAGLSSAHPSMPFLATAQTFSRSWIWQAVANASGEQRHSITAPASDTALTEGQVAVLGTLAFA